MNKKKKKRRKSSSAGSRTPRARRSNREKTEELSPISIGDRVGIVGEVMICLYGVFLTAVLPFLYRNNYIDINTYKYTAFAVATCAFFGAFCACAAIRAVLALLKKNGLSIRAFFSRLRLGDAAMLAFLLVSALACALSENRELSFVGLTGRKTGLQFILLISAAYILFRSAKKALPCVVSGLTAGGALVSLLAVLNFLGIDPLNMYANLIPEQHEMFLSTIGNRNFFGAFLSVFLPVAASAFVFIKGPGANFCLPSVLLGFAAVLAGRSDLAFSGVGAAMLVLFFLSLKEKRTASRFLVLTATAAFAAIGMRHYYKLYSEQALFMYPSLSKTLLSGPGLDLPLWGIALASIACAVFIHRRGSEKALLLTRRIACIAFAALAALGLGLILYYTVSDKTPPFAEDLLKFDDNFGNYRGYIWTRAIRLFKGLGPLKMLIGLGPDMFKNYASRYYGIEMKAVTGAAFDNCHNEYLQYLLTSGILGLAAYLTALSTSFVALVRRIKAGDRSAAILIAALTGYAAQSLFNVNQPMTTPYVFLLMALSINPPAQNQL